MFARRTAGSAGRSAGASGERKNIPMADQGTRRVMFDASR
jgi:hypothetical protein